MRRPSIVSDFVAYTIYSRGFTPAMIFHKSCEGGKGGGVLEWEGSHKIFRCAKCWDAVRLCGAWKLSVIERMAPADIALRFETHARASPTIIGPASPTPPFP